MNVYTRSRKNSSKWLLGFVIFVVVMTVTFDDVSGRGVAAAEETNRGIPGSSLPDWYTYDLSNYHYSADHVVPGSPESSDPPRVPEPTSIILLAAGLGALRLLRRKQH